MKFFQTLILSRLIDFCLTSYNHDETVYTHNTLCKFKGGTVIGQWIALYRWPLKNKIVYKRRYDQKMSPTATTLTNYSAQ